MNPEENNQGNPEIGMTEDSFESVANTDSGSEEFFDALDSNVNGQIIDENPEVTQNATNSSEQATYNTVDTGSNRSGEQSQDGSDWQKRYKDSSREAVKWRDRYKQVEQFVPVLDAMKKDSGLVEHVRDYLVGGGKPAQSQFKAQAQQHQVTLDDVHYILNRDKAASNVAASTKQDMLNQMKNVRNMPTSASGVNSQGHSNDNPDRDVFNSILGFDSSKDNLFG
jgi:hypothetical protein